MKVWDGAGIELATPGSAVRFESVARHVTNCDAARLKTHVFLQYIPQPKQNYSDRKNM